MRALSDQKAFRGPAEGETAINMLLSMDGLVRFASLLSIIAHEVLVPLFVELALFYALFRCRRIRLLWLPAPRSRGVRMDMRLLYVCEAQGKGRSGSLLLNSLPLSCNKLCRAQ